MYPTKGILVECPDLCHLVGLVETPIKRATDWFNPGSDRLILSRKWWTNYSTTIVKDYLWSLFRPLSDIYSKFSISFVTVNLHSMDTHAQRTRSRGRRPRTNHIPKRSTRQLRATKNREQRRRATYEEERLRQRSATQQVTMQRFIKQSPAYSRLFKPPFKI